MSHHHSVRLGNGKREGTGLTAAGMVAKAEPGSVQNGCCFWSAAQWDWSNAVWENDWHHADWIFLTRSLHLDLPTSVIFSHLVFPKSVAAYLCCIAH